VCVVLIAKFTEGAWITVLLIPSLMFLMYAIHRHYRGVERATALNEEVYTAELREPMVLIPVERWSTVTEKTLRFAWSISKEISFVHVKCEEDDEPEFERQWRELVEAPAKKAQLPQPDLILLASPYRLVVGPIVEYVLKVQCENPRRHITILVPELIEHHWYNFLLHNHRPKLLKGLLDFKENQRIVVINIPWYLG
jgi:hypothetical protein